MISVVWSPCAWRAPKGKPPKDRRREWAFEEKVLAPPVGRSMGCLVLYVLLLLGNLE